MSDAAGRFKRLLGLLPRFAERERWSLTELADAFGVSAAEIAEDLDALAARYDDPAGFMPSVAVYLDGDAVVVRTNHFRRPMRVTVRELCALELGLALMSHQEGAGSGIPSLREQLAAAIARLPRDAAYDGLQQGALTGDDGGKWLPLLRRAVRGGRVVHLRYQGAHHGEGTLRAVRPYALVYGRGKWYLVGWCERAKEERVFRTDRMVEVVITDRSYPVPTEFALERIVIEDYPFTKAMTSEVLVLRYGPAIARWIAERDGQGVEPDGAAIRRYPLADREWAIRHVLQYGPDVEILEPLALRGEVVKRLETRD